MRQGRKTSQDGQVGRVVWAGGFRQGLVREGATAEQTAQVRGPRHLGKVASTCRRQNGTKKRKPVFRKQMATIPVRNIDRGLQQTSGKHFPPPPLTLHPELQNLVFQVEVLGTHPLLSHHPEGG